MILEGFFSIMNYAIQTNPSQNILKGKKAVDILLKKQVLVSKIILNRLQQAIIYVITNSLFQPENNTSCIYRDR